MSTFYVATASYVNIHYSKDIGINTFKFLVKEKEKPKDIFLARIKDRGLFCLRIFEIEKSKDYTKRLVETKLYYAKVECRIEIWPKSPSVMRLFDFVVYKGEKPEYKLKMLVLLSGYTQHKTLFIRER